MSSSNSQAEPLVAYVGDASVIINLNATGRAAEIIAAFGRPFLVTENACDELREGARKGHDDYTELMKLIDAGLVKKVSLNETALVAYEQLVDGSSARTLDDGEAATIAHAHATSTIPLLDERKARSLCAAQFPSLRIVCSAELLMDQVLEATFGARGQTELIVNALKIGRMRVPPEHVDRIRAIIGEENAAQCVSLPKSKR